jgi:hypothetical protein
MEISNDISIENNIDNYLKSSTIVILKFDKENSLYDNFIYSLDYKIVNITDTDIINFYDIENLPSLYIYKNKNLIGFIEGFYTKTILLKKIKNIIE